MKKTIFAIATVCTLSLSSCMINTHVIGSGAKGGAVIEKKSLYILGNRISEADTKSMASGLTDYTIETRSNLLDMLINGVTGGIINTRTVRVKK